MPEPWWGDVDGPGSRRRGLISAGGRRTEREGVGGETDGAGNRECREVAGQKDREEG